MRGGRGWSRAEIAEGSEEEREVRTLLNALGECVRRGGGPGQVTSTCGTPRGHVKS